MFPVYNLELQQKMLSYCRAYSKYRYKNAKKLIKINIQKQNINALIDFIKTYTSKLAEKSQENKPQTKNSKIPNNSNKVDDDFPKIEEYPMIIRKRLEKIKQKNR